MPGKQRSFRIWYRGRYNALALVKSSIKHINMVEPNETERREIAGLLTAAKVEKDRYSIFSDMMENFYAEKNMILL